MFYPNFEDFNELSKQFSIIPVSMKFTADTETPVTLYSKYSSKSPRFLLESVEGTNARYSFISCGLMEEIVSIQGTTRIIKDGVEVETFSQSPVDVLEKRLAGYNSPIFADLPPFTGGAVGFFGYDLVRYVEKLPNAPHDDLNLPDSHFIIASDLIAFDHKTQQAYIIANAMVDGDAELAYKSATERIEAIYQQIKSSDQNTTKSKPNIVKSVTSDTSEEEFCQSVLKAKEYIKNGDIFQVVLSQRMSVETTSDPFDVYRSLRLINPSPYMFYFDFGTYHIAGASPEMLAKVNNGIIETCPIAGTRKRGKNAEEDLELANDLLADPKERAEHTMLVDLGRNDVGKVSEFGSVEISEYMKVYYYSHVMHLVSLVKGKLRKGLSRFDALRAIMPAGTLSGAPKVRAMEIIDELEKHRRGAYGGAVGYAGFEGSFDSCITIRTVVFKDNVAHIRSGAGIVADSVPEKEYEETMNKANAVLSAIKQAGEAKWF